MNVPHAFRILAVDDEWKTQLRVGNPGTEVLHAFLHDVLDITVEYQAGGETERLRISAPEHLDISAGFVAPGFHKTNLAIVDSMLRWRYDEMGRPVLAEGTAVFECGSPVDIEIDSATVPAGFWIRCDSVRNPSGDGRTVDAWALKEPVEVFVVDCWPIDRLEDLVGARDNHSRFWNVLVLDNLIERDRVDESQLAYGPEPLALGGGDAIEVFRYFRHPEVTTDKDIRWIPDRRTQVIVETSKQETSFSGDVERKIWPWFEIRKAELVIDRDQAVTEYRPPFPLAPREVTWRHFTDTVHQVADRVYRWHSPRIDSLMDPDGLVERYSVTDHPVFLIGPPGVGKSFVAEAIHEMSNRAAGPFVAVNCAAIPREGNFFESSLFGRELNATGNNSPAVLGHIQEAEGGTLFLDEIHHLTPEAQAKLLVFVQDRTYRPLGAETDFEADVRLIVATNKKLKDIPRSFEPDFLQRLSFYRIVIPPLSEYEEPGFVKLCRMAFDDVRRKVVTGQVGRLSSSHEEEEDGNEERTAPSDIPGFDAFEQRVRGALDELNASLTEQRTHVFALHCTVRGPGRSATVARLRGNAAARVSPRPSSDNPTLEQKIRRMLRRRRTGDSCRRVVGFSRSQEFPLVTLCPSLIQHVEKLEIEASVFKLIHANLRRPGEWKDRFDSGGNIRYLRQLFERAIYMHLGRDSLRFEHIEQAFRSGDAPYKFVIESPDAAGSGVVLSSTDGAFVELVLGCLRSTNPNDYSVDAAEVDVRAAAALLALWCNPGSGFEVPEFDAWVSAPQTIRFSGSGAGTLLTGIPAGRHTKWQVIVVLSFLLYLNYWNVTEWKAKRQVNDYIRRICSNTQFSRSNRKETAAPVIQVEEALTTLGLKWKPQAPLQLDRLNAIWGGRLNELFETESDTKRQYVEALVSGLRTLRTERSRVWNGQIAVG